MSVHTHSCTCMYMHTLAHRHICTCTQVQLHLHGELCACKSSHVHMPVHHAHTQAHPPSLERGESRESSGRTHLPSPGISSLVYHSLDDEQSASSFESLCLVQSLGLDRCLRCMRPDEVMEDWLGQGKVGTMSTMM